MLATSKSGERSRRWLQERIWGSRERTNSQASLRRELSNLRPLVHADGRPLLIIAHETVALDLERVVIDVRDRKRILESRGEFLEGIDIAWEEGFEDWLRDERQAIEAAREGNIGADWIAEGASVGAAASISTDTRTTLSIIVHDDPMPVEHGATIDRLADLLVERAARLRWLSLVGGPTKKLKIDGPTNLMRLGKALGVDYLLHCQFNADETVTIALSQAKSSRLLWSDRHALSGAAGTCDPARIADESIAVAIARIEADQIERIRGRPVAQLATHELLWRARWHMDRLNRDDARLARELLEIAATREPESLDVLLEQARCETADMWATGVQDTINELRRKLILARDMDPYSARTWTLLGIIDLWSARHDSAAALLHEAIRLEPSMSTAYAHLGSCYTYTGHPADGIRLLNNAMRLNPHDIYHFHRRGQLALANLMEGNTAEAVQEANAALARRPGYWLGHVYKIAALRHGGDQDAAREAHAAFRSVKPRFDATAIEKIPFRDPKWNEELRDALSETTDQ